MDCNFFQKSKKVTAFLIIFSILSSYSLPFFVPKAQAQWVVFDPVTEVNTGVTAASHIGKEYGADTLAWIIINLIIERIAASTVNWINSGFRGSPSFISDPGKYFGDLGDKIAGQYIFSNPKLNFLCGPISAKIRLALTTNYIGDNIQWQCTLTQVGRNLDDFMNDFENGGWENFFELTQRQQNNPIGAYLQAENELSIQIATRQGIKEKELSWGRGFMTLKRCKPGTVTNTFTGAQTPGGQTDGGFDGAETPGEEYYQNLPDDPSELQPGQTCEEETTTPGAVIETKLNDVLNIGNNKLAVADEINEIISALLNQLVSAIVGGIGKGLRALSSRDSSNNNAPSFTQQLASSTSISDLFGNQVDLTTGEQLLDSIEPPGQGGTNPDTLIGPNGATCEPGDVNCPTNP